MAIEDLYERACQAVERNNWGWAVKLFREVLRHDPEFEDARAAMRMSERRQFEESATPLHLVLKPFRMLLTSLRALIAKPRKKLEIYEDFLEKEPNSFWGLAHAAAGARKAGLLEVAAQIYEDAVKIKPQHKGALRKLADALKELGRNGEAAKFLNRIAQQEPGNRDLQAELRDLEASEHMAATRYDEAESFRETIRDTERAAELEESHRMAVAKDDLHAEIDRLESELEENPKQVNRILRLSRLYRDAGELETALKFLEEKRELLPDNYEIREQFGDARIELYDRKIAELAERVEQNPEDTEAQARLQELQQERNEYAMQELSWRLSEHPTDRGIQERLGHLYYEEGDYNAAIATFQALGQDARHELEAARMLGRCFMAKGQHDLALEQFKRAIENHPEMDDEGKELRYNLAQAHEEAGETEQALKVYKKIYSQDINFRDVSEKVDALSE